jgi:putative spermidine/putrescine transport system permease protein
MRGERVSLLTSAWTLLLLIPLVVVLLTSVNPGEYALFPPSGFSLKWYSTALTNPGFRSSLVLSVKVALLAVAFGLLIAVPAAIAVTRGSRLLRRVVQPAGVAPLIAPEILLALGLLIFFNSQVGLGSGLVALIAGHVLVGVPLALQVCLAGLASQDPNLEQAAWTLGAGKVRAFAAVTLPAIAPAIASAALFMFIFSFDNVSMSLFLAAPGQTTLPIQMYQYLEYQADPTVAAMSGILVGLGVILAVVLAKVGGLRHLASGAGG